MSMPKIMRYPAVEEATGINRSKIEDLTASGDFPKAVKLTEGGRTVGFFADEVAAYIEWRRLRRDKETELNWKAWFAKWRQRSA